MMCNDSLGWRLRFSEPGRCSWSTFGTRHCCTALWWKHMCCTLVWQISSLAPNTKLSWLRSFGFSQVCQKRLREPIYGVEAVYFSRLYDPNVVRLNGQKAPEKTRKHAEIHGEMGVKKHTENAMTAIFCFIFELVIGIHGMWEWNEIRREGDRSKSLKMHEGASWKLQGQLPATCGGANAGEDDRKNRDEPSTTI